MAKLERVRKAGRGWVVATLLLSSLFAPGCDDEVVQVVGSGPFSLRFSLGADFQQFGGETVNWVLLRSDIGTPVAAGAGTISPVTNPAFTLETAPVMLFGVPHEVHYWIDSNIDTGTPGVCDPPSLDEDDRISGDPQWIAPFGGATNDLVFLALFDARQVQDICATFFCGDGTIDPGEECDDGNRIDEDGCSASCTVEDGG